MDIGINGFGRIGRTFFRAFSQSQTEASKQSIIAANDLGRPEDLKYLVTHDTAYGQASQPTIDELEKLNFLAEKDPARLPWKNLGVKIVVESTGRFTTRDAAAAHLEAGAEKVIISAPCEDADITLIPGVNLKQYDPDKHQVISMGSCTTNCLVPLASLVHKEFEIERGSFHTTHAYTADQNLVDGTHNKDPRRGRAAAANIVPTTTGAAKTIFQIFPELKGKITGLALRVPVTTVSILDAVFQVKKATNKEEILDIFEKASKNEMAGILKVEKELLVSSDFIGNSHSAILDAAFVEVVDGNLVHLVAWYDNEWGYSSRLADLCAFLDSN